MENTRKEFEKIKHELLKKDEYKTCSNCGSSDNIHLHHITPLAIGGTNEESNIVPLCEECHGKIHGMDLTNHAELTKAGIERAKHEEVEPLISVYEFYEALGEALDNGGGGSCSEICDIIDSLPIRGYRKHKK